MIETRVNLYLVGERDYVYFPTVFDQMIRSIKLHYCKEVINPLILIKHFKIHKKITNRSLIRIYDIDKINDTRHKKKIMAEMQCSINDDNLFIGLYEESLVKVVDRVETIEDKLVGTIKKIDSFSGSCDKIKFDNDYELIQACCATNKQLHLMTLPSSNIRNRIKSIMLMNYTCYNEAKTCEAKLNISNLEIKENFNHIFTHNFLEIDLTGQSVNFHLYYSIKK